MSGQPILTRLIATAIVGLASSSLAAQSQTDMNQDACARYKQADQVLNTTYPPS
jgi:uncharacterized protein YecT (DUF1311 family)